MLRSVLARLAGAPRRRTADAAPRPRRPAPALEALEPRYMLDGDGFDFVDFAPPPIPTECLPPSTLTAAAITAAPAASRPAAPAPAPETVRNVAAAAPAGETGSDLLRALTDVPDLAATSVPTFASAPPAPKAAPTQTADGANAATVRDDAATADPAAQQTAQALTAGDVTAPAPSAVAVPAAAPLPPPAPPTVAVPAAAPAVILPPPPVPLPPPAPPAVTVDAPPSPQDVRDFQALDAMFGTAYSRYREINPANPASRLPAYADNPQTIGDFYQHESDLAMLEHGHEYLPALQQHADLAGEHADPLVLSELRDAPARMDGALAAAAARQAERMAIADGQGFKANFIDYVNEPEMVTRYLDMSARGVDQLLVDAVQAAKAAKDAAEKVDGEFGLRADADRLAHDAATQPDPDGEIAAAAARQRQNVEAASQEAVELRAAADSAAAQAREAGFVLPGDAAAVNRTATAADAPAVNRTGGMTAEPPADAGAVLGEAVTAPGAAGAVEAPAGGAGVSMAATAARSGLGALSGGLNLYAATQVQDSPTVKAVAVGGATTELAGTAAAGTALLTGSSALAATGTTMMAGGGSVAAVALGGKGLADNIAAGDLEHGIGNGAVAGAGALTLAGMATSSSRLLLGGGALGLFALGYSLPDLVDMAQRLTKRPEVREPEGAVFGGE